MVSWPSQLSYLMPFIFIWSRCLRNFSCASWQLLAPLEWMICVMDQDDLESLLYLCFLCLSLRCLDFSFSTFFSFFFLSEFLALYLSCACFHCCNFDPFCCDACDAFASPLNKMATFLIL